MKTVLIVVFMSLTNPAEPARMVHKAFESPAACQRAFINTMAAMPVEPTVKVAAFCENIETLADESEK